MLNRRSTGRTLPFIRFGHAKTPQLPVGTEPKRGMGGKWRKVALRCLRKLNTLRRKPAIRQQSPIQLPEDPLHPHLPHLPTELWRKIICYTVRPAGSLAVDIDCPFEGSPPEDRHIVSDATLFADRLAMELVCIGWRPYVLEVCSEHLVLHNDREVAISLRKLRNKDPKGRPYGERTKRLDFSFLKPRYSIDGIIELFKCTPNLLVYVNGNISDPLPEQQTPTEIIQGLVKHCGKSLRRVEWAGEGESPAFLDLDILATGAPNLHTLHLRCIYSFSRNHDSRHPILAFPNLKTLSLGLIPTSNEVLPPRPSTWDLFLALLCLNPIQLPSLERLEVDIFPDLFFLVTHGPKIRYLRTTSWSFASVLQAALPLCVNLNTLVISQTTNKLKFPSSHPTLARFCILPHVEQYVLVPERVFTYAVLEPLDDLFLGLEAMTAPELKEIRIRNTGGFSGIITRTIWLEGWWQRWHERGVALTDKRGHAFEVVKRLPF